VHGAPLGEEDLAEVKRKFGFDPSARFVVPEAVRSFYARCKERGREAESAWEALRARYAEVYPDFAAELGRRLAGELPAGWSDGLPSWGPDSPPLATRQSSQAIINKLAERYLPIFFANINATFCSQAP
jgi:transketolase